MTEEKISSKLKKAALAKRRRLPAAPAAAPKHTKSASDDKTFAAVPVSASTTTALGELLHEARRQKGLKLFDVARDLKLRPEYLEAIEEGRLEALPPPPYALGFVRSYASYLGLNIDDCEALLPQSQKSLRNDTTTFKVPHAIDGDRLPSRTVLMIAGAAVLGLISLGYLLFGSSSHDPVPPIPETKTPTESTSAAPLPEATPTLHSTLSSEPASSDQTESPDETWENHTPPAAETPFVITGAAQAEGKATKERIMIRAKATSWIRLYDPKGFTHVDRVLKLGDTVPAPEGLFLSTGNAGGIEILLDGKPLNALGRQGLVRRDLKMDPATLVAQLADTSKDAPMSAAQAKEPNTPSVAAGTTGKPPASTPSQDTKTVAAAHE